VECGVEWIRLTKGRGASALPILYVGEPTTASLGVPTVMGSEADL